MDGRITVDVSPELLAVLMAGWSPPVRVRVRSLVDGKLEMDVQTADPNEKPSGEITHRVDPAGPESQTMWCPTGRGHVRVSPHMLRCPRCGKPLLTR